MSSNTLFGPMIVKLEHVPEPIKGVSLELSMSARHASTQGIWVVGAMLLG